MSVPCHSANQKSGALHAFEKSSKGKGCAIAVNPLWPRDSWQTWYSCGYLFESTYWSSYWSHDPGTWLIWCKCTPKTTCHTHIDLHDAACHFEAEKGILCLCFWLHRSISATSQCCVAKQQPNSWTCQLSRRLKHHPNNDIDLDKNSVNVNEGFCYVDKLRNNFQESDFWVAHVSWTSLLPERLGLEVNMLRGTSTLGQVATEINKG